MDPKPISALGVCMSQSVDSICCLVIPCYDTGSHYDVTVIVCTVNFKYV